VESSIYQRARQEWDERYADLVLGKRNWQIAAAGSIAVSLILAGGIVWLCTRSRFVPNVVEVDKLGYALTAPQALSSDSSSQLADDRIVRYELAGFIRSAREVIADQSGRPQQFWQVETFEESEGRLKC
jgi:type IV secretory pathway TrbF-like protein